MVALPSVLLSNRGLALPAVHGWLPYAALGLAALALGWRARRRWGKPALYGALAVALLGWTLLPPLQLDLPVRRGLGSQGGWQPSIEFAALTLGLVVFHAAYIADIVRASVRAVPVGLVEAGQALGLAPRHVLRLVIAPYAARVALPPYANPMPGPEEQHAGDRHRLPGADGRDQYRHHPDRAGSGKASRWPWRSI